MHVVITGASSGLGAAMARHWAQKGATLTVAARREERLRALAEEVDVPVFVRPTDLDELAQCKDLIDEARAEVGPIDILVNNAGVQYVEPTAQITPERINTLMHVDLLAPLHLMYYVLSEMMERGEGTIVNIASVAGIVHTPGMAHYNGAKAGLAAASESLRVEIEGSGVHVLTVYPGPVTSEMETAAREQFADSGAVDNIPTGTPEGLAEAVDKGVRKRSARVIYPKIYSLSRTTRNLSQWLTNKFTPPLKSEG